MSATDTPTDSSIESATGSSRETATTVDFADAYSENLERVWRFVRARIPDHHEAHDVTSDVFVRAWRSWDRFDPGRPVQPWLFTIAHRAVADWWRSSRPELAGSADLAARVAARHDPEADVLRSELLVQLGQALDGLSQRERDGLALRFAARLSMRHVAEVLGTSVGAAKMMIHRAVRRLADDTLAATPVSDAQAADLESVIDDVLARGHAVLSDSELHGLLVHLAAAHDEPVPDDLPGHVAHCVRCEAEEELRTTDAADDRGPAGLARITALGATLLAFAGVCLACTVPALGALLTAVGIGAAGYLLHLVGVAAAPLVLWMVHRGMRRHRHARGYRWALAGAAVMGLHALFHVGFAIAGSDAVFDTLGAVGDVGFFVTDQVGTVLLIVGAVHNLVDLNRWRTAERSRFRAAIAQLG